MPQFVMVISQATSEQFEKIISIQVKSKDKIRFLPQGAQGTTVNSPPLVASSQQVTRNNQAVTEQFYSNIRLEFGDDAAQFAHEIYDLFSPRQAQQQKVG